MNARASNFTASGKKPAARAARLHPFSPALISGHPAWLQTPAAPGNKSAAADPFAGPRTETVLAPTGVQTQTNQESFALKEPIYEGT